jgi:Skp family chaperone for outer membrane proteins
VKRGQLIAGVVLATAAMVPTGTALATPTRRPVHAQAPAAAPAEAPVPPPSAHTRFIVPGNLARKPPAGIPEFAAATQLLAAEFRPAGEKLRAIFERMETTVAARDAAIKAGDKAKSKARQDEALKLADEGKALQAQTQARLEARQVEVMGPVREKIIAALNGFAAQHKDYEMRLAQSSEDAAAMAGAGGKDVTDEFVRYYNANAPK